MAQTNLNIRIDEDVKKNFDDVCNKLGLTMTTAITVFAQTVIRQNRIPFEISLDIPNEETRAAIEEVQQMKKNPQAYKGYTDVDALMTDLLG